MTNSIVKTATIKELVDSYTGLISKGKVEKNGGKRIGYYYIILKSLKESRKNDVVKCLYIKGFTSFGYCVIKEGSRGDTKDKQGRDIQDRLRWQRELHERLAGKVRMPRLLGTFEENGNYYLVMEYIKGKSLYNVMKNNRNLRQNLLEGGKAGVKMLGYLEQIIRILLELHRQQVVHRDVTLNNFMIMPGGKVAVIDMELSYSLIDHFPDPPFALGTFGYMSPEQESIAVPTVKEDIFALGAILLHIWTGISPYKFINMPVPDRQMAIEYFVRDSEMVEIILQCLRADAQQRPEAPAILQRIIKYREDKINRKNRPFARYIPSPDSVIKETLEKGIHGLCDSIQCDPEKGWFAEHLNEKPQHSKDLVKAWYASFNRGVAGILYFLSRAQVMGYDISSNTIPIQQGINLIQQKYTENIERSNRGLHYGSDGIAMAIAEMIKNGMRREEDILLTTAFLDRDATKLGLMEGWAGQGIANLCCAPVLENTRESYFAEKLMDAQLPDGSWSISQKRPMYHMAYGQAGIIYFLLHYGAVMKNNMALDRANAGLNHLIRKARRTGATVTWKDGKDHLSEHWWCEGNTGMAIMFLKAFEVTRDPLYCHWANLTLTGHKQSRLWASLGLCHGIAGMGETFLEAARVLQDEKWFLEAGDCVQTILNMKQHTKDDRLFWYVEKERNPVANLLVGNSGVLHFLLRYLHPSKFSFPGLC